MPLHKAWQLKLNITRSKKLTMVSLKDNLTVAHDQFVHVVYELIEQHAVLCII